MRRAALVLLAVATAALAAGAVHTWASLRPVTPRDVEVIELGPAPSTSQGPGAEPTTTDPAPPAPPSSPVPAPPPPAPPAPPPDVDDDLDDEDDLDDRGDGDDDGEEDGD